MLAAFAAPLEIHLFAAASAARAVADRRARVKLVPDVELMSIQMDTLAQILSAEPRLAWQRSFAAAFDAENVLRQAIGVERRARPYSGRMDPTIALKRAGELASGQDVAGPPDVDLDPNAMAEAVLKAISLTFERQKDGISALYRDLNAKEPEALSFGETLLDVAIDMALGNAAGELGNLAAQSLQPALKKITNEAVRTAVSEMVKDAAKDMFKAGIKAGGAPSASRSTDLLAAFVNGQEARLTAAKGNATLKSVGLAPALAQAELPQLLALWDAVLRAQSDAQRVQYEQSMREWENLRARASGGEADSHSGADLRRPFIPGVLEIDVEIDSSHVVTVRRVHLANGEAPARKWLHDAKLRLGETGLNERYNVNVVGSPARVVFAVAPSGALQVETLGADQLAILKVLAAHHAPTPWNVRSARAGGYDHISDEAARSLAGAIVTLAGGRTTELVEEDA